jgi:molybdopterin converting factor subunit 1
MTVRVRLFAALRDAVGCDSFELAAHERLDVVAVIDAIRARFGDAAYAAVSAENVRVAVNREFVTHPFRLNDGDEIAFMPPVTGG